MKLLYATRELISDISTSEDSLDFEERLDHDALLDHTYSLSSSSPDARCSELFVQNEISVVASTSQLAQLPERVDKAPKVKPLKVVVPKVKVPKAKMKKAKVQKAKVKKERVMVRGRGGKGRVYVKRTVRPLRVQTSHAEIEKLSKDYDRGVLKAEGLSHAARYWTAVSILEEKKDPDGLQAYFADLFDFPSSTFTKKGRKRLSAIAEYKFVTPGESRDCSYVGVVNQYGVDNDFGKPISKK